MWAASCADTLLESKKTPIVLLFIYFPLVFLNLGYYVGYLRFQVETYGQSYLDAYLAFVVLATAAFLLPAAGCWIYAAKFAHEATLRANRVLTGLMILCAMHDCPFFFLEMVSLLSIHQNERSVLENVVFGFSTIGFGISFIPAWLQWIRMNSEYCETTCCREEGETYSFQYEYEGCVGPLSKKEERSILEMMAKNGKKLDSLSPAHQNRGRFSGSESNHDDDEDDNHGDDPFPPPLPSSKKGSGGNNNNNRGKPDRFASIISPPKEIFAYSTGRRKIGTSNSEVEDHDVGDKSSEKDEDEDEGEDEKERNGDDNEAGEVPDVIVTNLGSPVDLSSPTSVRRIGFNPAVLSSPRDTNKNHKHFDFSNENIISPPALHEKKDLFLATRGACEKLNMLAGIGIVASGDDSSTSPGNGGATGWGVARKKGRDYEDEVIENRNDIKIKNDEESSAPEEISSSKKKKHTSKSDEEEKNDDARVADRFPVPPCEKNDDEDADEFGYSRSRTNAVDDDDPFVRRN